MRIKILIPTLIIASLLLNLAQTQIEGDQYANANFQGSFQSSHADPYEENSEESLQQNEMLQFAQQMGQFIADQSFSFTMGTHDLEQFILYPGADKQIVRGMFHYETIGDEQEDGHVTLDIFDNQNIYRSYKQQRLGIFKIYHNLRDHSYKFRFFNSNAKVEVYFSYEFVESSKINVDNTTTKNVSQIQQVRRQFQKVNKLIIQQERQMNRLLVMSQKHQLKINRYMSAVEWSIVFQTILISISNMVCLYFLKKQIYSGYQLLV